jgi:hypothetical protein
VKRPFDNILLKFKFLQTLQLGVFESLLLLALVLAGARIIIDPDFGWHLRSGTDLLKNLSVPKLDPYSYTIPDWPWVNHEWLSDGIVAFFYNNLGAFFVILLFAVFIASAFILGASVAKVELKYKILAALIAVLAALPILGVRMQMITLFGMALTLWLLYRWRKKEIKSLWWLPVIFLLWANLHGGFTIGLVLIALFFAVELIKYLFLTYKPTWYKKMHVSEATLDKAQLKSLLGFGALSGLVTFINPYGYGLYLDFWRLFTTPFATENIREWQSVDFTHATAQNYIMYLVIFAIVLALTYRKIEPTRWVITITFGILSLLYWRNMPFMMIMSVGFLAEILQDHTHLAFEQVVKNKYLMIATVILVALITSQRIVDVVPKTTNMNQTFLAASYPINAVNWIKVNPNLVGKNLFNEYNWGGFLIWQLPEYKVFLDGRMPFWRNEERFIFQEETYALDAAPGSIEMLVEKYDVDWVLIKSGRPLDFALNGQKETWTKIYNDAISVIYRRI